MRLFELAGKHGKLPARAGLARLEWTDRRTNTPRRDGSTIILPLGADVEFFPLSKRRQFLAHIWRGEQGHQGWGPTPERAELYFGGTDEQPFLVQLQPEALQSLAQGEDGFFEALKPVDVRLIENAYGQPAVRQGDWFAVPLPLELSLKIMAGVLVATREPETLNLVPTTNGGTPLNRTRHNLNGGWIGTRGRFLFGEGVLKAPDHEDKELSGPHALFQTAYLASPQQAD